MARLVLDLAPIARLTHDCNAAYMHPWHDAATDRDIVTNGRVLLSWDGHQFAPAPGPEQPDAKIIGELLEPVAEIGKTTLRALRAWAEWGSPECCDGHEVVCTGCGEEVCLSRAGRFYHADVDRYLLRRLLAPLGYGDTPVTVCSRGGEEAIQLVAERWTAIIMPLRSGKADLEGPAFPPPAETTEAQS